MGTLLDDGIAGCYKTSSDFNTEEMAVCVFVAVMLCYFNVVDGG